jgi:two-component system NtrC family sensor kinase
MDADAIQAFRLGASDYLVKPLREAELVTAVERAIHETRLRHERSRLAEQLTESNRQLERRVRELTTLFGIGKMVTSATHQGQLFNKLMEASLYVTEADVGWILLHDENSEQLILRAQRNLPAAQAGKLHHPWDDEVSTLVMLSGEALAIHGDGLAQFKLRQYGKAALIAPISVRDRPIGVITVTRQGNRPFSERDQSMLEAVADYASISLVNARLFHALEARAQRMQELIEKAAMDAQIFNDWRNKLDQGMRILRGKIAGMLESIKDPVFETSLQALDQDLETLSKQAAELPTAEIDESPDISDTRPAG